MKEQNCKECGHAELIDLEIGSIIVLACKRIKDLSYLAEEFAEKNQILEQEGAIIQEQFMEKSRQLEQLQQNLIQMLSGTSSASLVNQAYG